MNSAHARLDRVLSHLEDGVLQADDATVLDEAGRGAREVRELIERGLGAGRATSKARSALPATKHARRRLLQRLLGERPWLAGELSIAFTGDEPDDQAVDDALEKLSRRNPRDPS